MAGILDGVRVVELATWGFVPAAGVALADWGAEVIKVEHPTHGDPMRGLVSSSLKAKNDTSVSFMFQTFSRGKSSVGVDLKAPGGRETLLSIIETADVFITNYLPTVRAKLGVDVDDLRAVNPRLVYAKGSGLGPVGDEADTGGFDLASYWSRGGVAYVSTDEDDDHPPPLPGSAFGDLQSGLYAAGGVAGALFHRERTGEAQVVDVSLLGAAVWATAPHIAASSLYDIDAMERRSHSGAANPISNTYRTGDDRFIALVMLESDRFWAPLTEVLGHPELASDPRFVDSRARAANHAECIAELDAIFASRPLADWTSALARQRGVWAVVQSPREVSTDPQVIANNYVRDMDLGDAGPIRVVMNPIQYGGRHPAAAAAPDLGADTDRILLDLGFDWDKLIELKTIGAIT
ncbi:CaiB/BaiF CoA transferase family protein [Gordonia terrae]